MADIGRLDEERHQQSRLEIQDTEQMPNLQGTNPAPSRTSLPAVPSRVWSRHDRRKMPLAMDRRASFSYT